MAGLDPEVQLQALDWLRRIHDKDFADWDGHIEWLEASPAHLAAFDAVSLSEADAVAMLSEQARRRAAPKPANDNGDALPGRRHARGIGIAVAATIVAAVAAPTLLEPSARPSFVETGFGQHRTIALADGSRIELNGNSRLVLDGANARAVSLERGEAMFIVVHDAAQPFSVRAGETEVRDVGTVFNVVRMPRETEVSVRQGRVLINPHAESIPLGAGQTIRDADGAGNVELGQADAAAVGAWTMGRLIYRDIPFSRVADDLARNVGEPVDVSADLSARLFTGVILLDRDSQRLFTRLSQVMGCDVTHGPTGWRLTSRARDKR